MITTVLIFTTLVLVIVLRKKRSEKDEVSLNSPASGSQTETVSAPQSKPRVSSENFKAEVEHFSHYYQLLSEREKVDFLKRAWIFFHEKNFEARGFDRVSLRMRVIISAYAAQITFGLPDIRLVHFKTIIVYPEAYQSALTKQWHKGEANYAGAVVFSWKDLTDGHNNLSDGVNLAIHEFAHALRLENVTPPDEFGFLDDELLREFRQVASAEMKRIADTDNHLLREYGATNEQEFFAVCVENFFERPIAFCEEHPDVYCLLTKLLGQDPLVRPIRLQNA